MNKSPEGIKIDAIDATNFVVCKVKWERKVFSDLIIDVDAGPSVFKHKLHHLTGVRPERQKILCKGKMLKSEDEWNLELKNGDTIMMTGSTEAVPQGPKVPYIFFEDLANMEKYINIPSWKKPTGVINLGRSSFLNVILQCLRCSSELRANLYALPEDEDFSLHDESLPPSKGFTYSLKHQFISMDFEAPKQPKTLAWWLYRASPYYKNSEVALRQHSPFFCWSMVLNLLTAELQPQKLRNQQSEQKSLIDQLFRGTFEDKTVCIETEKETASVEIEIFSPIPAFLDGAIQTVDEGLRSYIRVEFERYSETLGREAKYLRTTLFNRLPGYLLVVIERFDGHGKTIKPRKEVSYPFQLDVFDMCTPELQKKLAVNRCPCKFIENDGAGDGAGNNRPSCDCIKKPPYDWDTDYGCNKDGLYTLRCVITHNGDSTDTGKYIAWTKYNEISWFKLDDDVVTQTTVDQALRLGEGDKGHYAYLLLYRYIS